MERKCLRCQTPMLENCHLNFSHDHLLLCHELVIDRDDYTKATHHLKCAYCPSCGYVETYFETEPIKQIAPRKVSNSYQEQVIAKKKLR
ncbi:MAG: hypothetical protein PHI41_03480 [Erysipelotrichaceae bacterium]|nr:hypothetical protein [Erysipelotrichaceae bacterium]MDD3809688.1 hypothetical protein [Erysipelotrichaceae bacterium]